MKKMTLIFFLLAAELLGIAGILSSEAQAQTRTISDTVKPAGATLRWTDTTPKFLQLGI